MPCPFFEPTTVASNVQFKDARLPLLEEYEGCCHATHHPFPIPSELRFQSCNQGYPRGICNYFPPTEIRSCIRFDVAACNAEAIDLLCVAERDHAPIHWHRVRFVRATEEVVPALTDTSARAQVVAFCRSYLRRFSG